MISCRVPFAAGVTAALVVVLLSIVPAAPGHADPVLGFHEEWTGTSVDGWGGGSVYSNPGTGGVGGAGDGFLLVSQPVNGHFGGRSTGLEYTGDWTAAGVELVRLSLNDVGAADAVEIHFSIGSASNLWQYNTGFTPPNGAWQEFVVDLTDGTKFTRIIGAGTYAQALQFADRILLRSDLPPFGQNPDPAHGDIGVDHIILTAVATPTRSMTWGRIKRLYR